MPADADSNQVEELATEFAKRIRNGEDPSIDDYVAAYPHLEESLREIFPTIAALERLRQKKARPRDGRATLGPDCLERLGDLRIIREIGRGGMGVVYEAEQESLGRRVAVKVLPRQSLLDAKHLKRFEREARTAARLHHTNIVPVLGVGEFDGFHYYVMQFIDGIGLDRVIDLLRRRLSGGGSGEGRLSDILRENWKSTDAPPSTAAPQDDTSPRVSDTSKLPRQPSLAMAAEITEATTTAAPTRTGFSAPPSFRPRRGTAPLSVPGGRHLTYWAETAHIGLQVAEALDYAHQHGVLHRDVKPGNLILDREATVWVADFGLAKAAEHEALSRTGDIVGTLRYMAPEQFRGESDRRSDVYSLGVTLYELVTLQPFHEESLRKQAVLTGQFAHEPIAPRKHNPSIPRDLETIMMKAVAFEPGQRYASAGHLADDLRRFLEDRPITVRRTSISERLWRWTRRNRTVAALSFLASVLLLMVALVATAGYLRTTQALARESEQRTRAEKQRQQSEAALSASLDSLDALYRRFAPDRVLEPARMTLGDSEEEQVELPAPPVISKETAALLEGMLSMYDALAELDTDDVKLRRDAALANRRVGDIQQRMEQFTQAENAYGRAIDRYAELLGELGDDAELQTEAARAFNGLGNVHRQTGRLTEAAAAHRTALELLTELARPGSAPEIRYELAYTNYLIGKRPEAFLALPPGGPPGFRPDGDGRMRFRSERRFRDGMPERLPDSDGPPRPDRGPRDFHRDAGDFDHRRSDERRGDERETSPEAGLEPGPAKRHLERLPRPFPDPVDEFRRDPFPGETDAPPHGEKYLDEAIRLLTELRAEAPTVPEYGRLLALCYRDHPHQNRDGFDQSIKILQDLVKQYPDVPEFRFDLCETLAAVDLRRMSPEYAVELEKRLRTALAYARSLDANVPAFLDLHVRVLLMLGRVLQQSHLHEDGGRGDGRRQEAEKHLRDALELQTRLIALADMSLPALARLATSRQMLAGLLLDRGDPRNVEEAFQLLVAARESLEPRLGEGEQAGYLPVVLSDVHKTLVRVYHDRGQHDQARDTIKRIEQYRLERPRRDD